jgi:hypothetical protein
MLTEVFRSGGAAPDSDGEISVVSELILAESGSVVFEALVINTASGIDWRRLFLTDGVTLTEIARQNEIAPGEVDFRFTQFVGIDANGQDHVAFSSTLERNVAPPGNRTSAI